jgi:N-carbamoyl-L-amino-acid hydrolase
MELAGSGNHAGTTAMADRHDPMLTFAYTVLAANKEARLRGGHATIGRVAVEPNATNAVPSLVRAWLDARADGAQALAELVEAVRVRAGERASRDGTRVTLTAESQSPPVTFDPALNDRLRGTLDKALGRAVPVLATAAGHDAGVLAAHAPTTMLFVRNPTGISHAPAEHATDADCATGIAALAAVLEELACA